ncbi:MAG: sigma-70 family RNA polymerase sigma factor [Nannocystaceae bacterium]|nr:sigma-70 family RNA polymerase sigma factor [Nannocystaceae bacterium]
MSQSPSEPLSATLSARLGLPAVARDGLDAALEGMCRAGEDAWPKLALPRVRFVEWLAARVDPEQDPAQQLAGILATDAYLACACEAELPGALASFRQHFADVFARAFAGVRAAGQDPDDLEQRLLVHLFARNGERPGRIASYGGRGALRTWLRATAVRLRIDSERRVDREDRSNEPERLLQAEADRDPELEFLDRHHRETCRRALALAFSELEPRQRNVLRLHVLDGLGGTEIARIHGVDRATAKRWLARARADMTARTQVHLMALLGLDRARLDSVLAAVRSHIDVSVRMFLSEPAAVNAR